MYAGRTLYMSLYKLTVDLHYYVLYMMISSLVSQHAYHVINFLLVDHSIVQYILKLPPDGNLELLKGSVARRSEYQCLISQVRED